MLRYVTAPVGAFMENCRFVFNPETRAAAVCDPGDDARDLYRLLEGHKLKATCVILTHGHLDHCGAARELADLLGVKIIGPHRDDGYWLMNLELQAAMFGLDPRGPLVPDRYLADGESVDLGLGENAKALHCPGHTPGQICYYFEQSGLLLSGDVLFAGSIGRTDLPQGNYEELMKSIKEKLAVLPGNTRVLPGHGPETDMATEQAENPFLRGGFSF